MGKINLITKIIELRAENVKLKKDVAIEKAKKEILRANNKILLAIIKMKNQKKKKQHFKKY